MQIEVWKIVNVGMYGPSWRVLNKSDLPPMNKRDAGSATPELALTYAAETARQMGMRIESVDPDGHTFAVISQSAQRT